MVTLCTGNVGIDIEKVNTGVGQGHGQGHVRDPGTGLTSIVDKAVLTSTTVETALGSMTGMIGTIGNCAAAPQCEITSIWNPSLVSWLVFVGQRTSTMIDISMTAETGDLKGPLT